MMIWLLAATATAEADTVGDVYSVGAYGAPQAAVTMTGDGLNIMQGGRAGLVLNNSLVIGAHGMATSAVAGRGEGMNYGGLFVEGIFAHEAPIHPTLDLAVGGGDIWQGGYRALALVGNAAFRAEVNLSEWMRLAVGVGYTVTLPQTALPEPWILGRPSADFMVKFGSF